MKVRGIILLTVFAFSLVLLSCSSGSGPGVTFSLTSYDFGSVNIDENKKVDIVISNKKSIAVTLKKFTMTNYEFIVISGGTPGTRIQPKEDLTITIQFSPKLPGGLKDGTLKIEYNFGYEAIYQEIYLKGTSVPIPKVEVNPQSYDFKDLVVATSKSTNFSITNTGSTALNISSLLIVGPDASDFAITAGSSGLISYQQSMMVTVEFTPATAGTKSATLQISHNGHNYTSPINVTLSGEGYDVPAFSITPASPYDYGLVAKGDNLSKVFTIKNTGAGIMNMNQIVASGDFSVISGNAPFQVNPGATHDVEIEFTPSKYGLIQQSISFRSDTLTSPDVIVLKGEGFRGLPFEENFDNITNGQLPTDWTIYRGPTSTTAGTNFNWQVQNSTHRANKTGGANKYATADSEIFLSVIYEDYLTSPEIDCSTYSTGTVTLEFDGNFQSWTNLHETAAVEVYDGATWHRLDTWTTSWNANGEHKSYTITGYALGNSKLKVRFFYSNVYIYMMYFQIDNVKITRN